MDTKKSLITGGLVFFVGGLALVGYLYANFVSVWIVTQGLKTAGWSATNVKYHRGLKVTADSITGIPFGFGVMTLNKVKFTMMKPAIKEIANNTFNISLTELEAGQVVFYPDPSVQKAGWALTGNVLKNFDGLKVKSLQFDVADVLFREMKVQYNRLPMSVSEGRIARAGGSGEMTLTLGPATNQAVCPGSGKLNISKTSLRYACQNTGSKVSVEVFADGNTQYSAEGGAGYFKSLATALGAQKLWLELQGKTTLELTGPKTGPRGQHGFQVRGRMERHGQIYEFGTYNAAAATDQNWRSVMTDLSAQTQPLIVMNTRNSHAVEMVLFEMPRDARIPPLDLALGRLTEPRKYEFQSTPSHYQIHKQVSRTVIPFSRTSPKTMTKDFEQVAALRQPASEQRIVVGYTRNRVVKITEALTGDTLLHPRTGQIFCSRPFGLLDVTGCQPIVLPKLNTPEDKGNGANTRLVEFGNRLNAAPAVDLFKIVSDLQMNVDGEITKRHGDEPRVDAMALDTRRNRILLITNNDKDVSLPPSLPFLVFEINANRFSEITPRFPNDLEHLSVAYSEADDTFISLAKPVPDRAGTTLKLVRFRADNFEPIQIFDPPAEMTPILSGSPGGVQLMTLGANVFVRPKEVGPALFALNPKARTWNQGRVELDASVTTPQPAAPTPRLPASTKKH